MMFSSPGSIALQIGPLTIHWYGLIIVTGIFLAYGYALFEAKRRGLDQQPLEDAAFWMVLSGVLGARLYYAIFEWDFYGDHLLEILKIWKGGLAFHGALLGGAIAFFAIFMRRKLPLLRYADVIIPGVLLAQALGRWGNFFNNEAFGRPTGLPWKLFIPEAARPGGFQDFLYFHPTFLYESIWNFVGFLALAMISRKFFSGNKGKPAAHVLKTDKVPDGTILCLYLIWYSFGRFFIEGLRLDSLYLGPLRIAQIVSVLLFFGSTIWLIAVVKRSKIQ